MRASLRVISRHLWTFVFVFGSSLCATTLVELYSCCYSSATTIHRCLEDFDTVGVAELLVIDDCVLMTDCIHISTKSYYLNKFSVHFYHTPIYHKP